MSEKPESDDYEDDDAAEGADADDTQIDVLMRDLDSSRRRGAPRGGEPAWRRLEKYLEQKHTKELLSDFDDYDIDDEPPGVKRPGRQKAGR
jgi:N-glycosylase/DNA lyase